MVTVEAFKKLALSFPDSYSASHFEKTAFRTKKRIFATLDEAGKKAVLKLTEVDQSVFARIDPAIIYPVDNKWGKQGWTVVKLDKVSRSILKDALTKAFKAIASPGT